MKKIMKNLIFALSMIVMTLFVSSCEKEEITNVTNVHNSTDSIINLYFFKSDLNNAVLNVPNLDSNSTTNVSFSLVGFSPSLNPTIPDSTYLNNKIWSALPSAFLDSAGQYWNIRYVVDYNLKTITISSEQNIYPSNYFWQCILKVDIIK